MLRPDSHEAALKHTGRFKIVWFCCLLLAPVRAFADGCVIPATAIAKVQIPDQQALIHFADGTETLVS